MSKDIQHPESSTNHRYTNCEEQINTYSHAAGITIGVIAGYFLLRKASQSPDPFALGCVIVYLLGMLSSYITSTWYHGSRPGKTKEVLRKLDHAAIYIHIAASYTPFTLLTMRDSGMWGWGIFSFIWLSAIIGLILCFTNLKEHSNLETASFIGMGCAVLIAIKPLLDGLSAMNAMPAFWWMIGGGASYIIGALFYSRPKVKYMHCTFHVFCLGGSICHIIAIWLIL